MLPGGERGVVDAQTRSFIRPRRVGGAGGEEVPCLDWQLGEKKREREKRRRGRRESERGRRKRRRRSEGGRGGGRGGEGGGGGGGSGSEVAVLFLLAALVLGAAERCGLINFV